MVKCAITWGILAMLFQTLIPRIYNLTSGLVWVWAHLVGVNVGSQRFPSGNSDTPANLRSRSVTVCFTCARNILFQHKN